jgi:hypothetical protein
MVKTKGKEYWTVLKPHEVEQLNWIEKEVMKDKQEGPEIFKEVKSKIVMTPPDKRNAVFENIIADLKEATKYD